jgi:hypothetical protein
LKHVGSSDPTVAAATSPLQLLFLKTLIVDVQLAPSGAAHSHKEQ